MAVLDDRSQEKNPRPGAPRGRARRCFMCPEWARCGSSRHAATFAVCSLARAERPAQALQRSLEIGHRERKLALYGKKLGPNALGVVRDVRRSLGWFRTHAGKLSNTRATGHQRNLTSESDYYWFGSGLPYRARTVFRGGWRSRGGPPGAVGVATRPRQVKKTRSIRLMC